MPQEVTLQLEAPMSLDSTKPTVLIVDDDTTIVQLLQKFYSEKGYLPTTATSSEEALTKTFNKDRPFELVVCDLHLPHKSGMEVMREIKALHPKIPIIMITASQSIENAVSALKKGAFDYITKPLNLTELEIVSQRALQHLKLEKNYAELKLLTQTPREGVLLGNSQKMRELRSIVDRVGKSSANILISGESGSGKEMVARALHAKSGREEKPFVPVNCSAIPLNLLEAELFGYKKGAFTGAIETRIGLFEEAQGGTIFLDEIGDMPMALQTKLLRVLQEKKVKKIGSNDYKSIDVRIIAATHRDLKSAVRKNEFREDLYYRLNVIPIQVPPLRERKEDIPLLTYHFLKKFNLLNEKNIQGLSKEAMAKLRRFKWGGNVRELENTIERAVVLSSGPYIVEEDITTEGSLEIDGKVSLLFEELMPLRDLEKLYINYVLDKTGGRKDEASEVLGINRKTLYRKERDFKLK